MSPKLLRRQCKEVIKKIHFNLEISNNINFSTFGTYKPELKTITIFIHTIRTIRPLRAHLLLYTLLHEIGHALCFLIEFNDRDIYSVYRLYPVKFEKIADIFAIIMLRKIKVNKCLNKYLNSYRLTSSDRKLLRMMIEEFNYDN